MRRWRPWSCPGTAQGSAPGSGSPCSSSFGRVQRNDSGLAPRGARPLVVRSDQAIGRNGVKPQALGGGATPVSTRSRRSEEHTSELQSLMRNSYAVFCLKKKKHSNEE